LARSCHPAPVVAVTILSALLALAAHQSFPYVLLVPLAVFAGQLSIGWSNDRLDLRRDAAVRRSDKPLATGELDARTADIAIAVSIIATIALSLSLGPKAAVVHLVAVACGWSYNLGAKATWWSWLPYAAAFGALPAVATLAGPHGHWPAAWVIVAGALLGVTANVTNALPDLAGDRRTGMLGLPHRIGARPSLILATVLVVGASALLVVGPAGRPSSTGWAVLALVPLLAAAGLGYGWQRPTAKASFYGLILIVGLDVLTMAVSRTPLT
jgi:4-hydroxybenzoate polyprenyltransferase